MKNFLNLIQSYWDKTAYPRVTSRDFSILLILLGIILRLKHYFENRSLWLDEAYVAVDIISRSVMEIIKQGTIFIHQPRTPLGFSLIERGFIALMGNHEYALRIFPLISGILCLILFYHLLKRCVSPGAIPVALGLFAIVEPLVYYSAEVKPYSSDVFVTLMLYILIDVYQRKNKPLWLWALLGLFGGYAVWLSYPSIFTLAALGLTVTLMSLKNKEWGNASREILLYVFWLLNFYFVYKILISQMADSKYMWSFEIWKSSVLTEPFFSFAALTWFKNVFTTALIYPTSLKYANISAVFFCLGAYSIFKMNKMVFFKLILPLFLVLCAACLRQFPFGGRIILFMVPILLTFFSAGVVFVLKKLRNFSFPVGIVLLILLFNHPVQSATQNLLQSRSKEELREVMKYYSSNRKDGDGMIVNDYAIPQYWYYINSLGIDYRSSPLVRGKHKGSLIEGYRVGQIANKIISEGNFPDYVPYREIISIYNEDGIIKKYLVKSDKNRTLFLGTSFKFFGQNRFWIILPNYQPKYKNFVLMMLDNQAVRKEEFEGKGSSIYLFELI